MAEPEIEAVPRIAHHIDKDEPSLTGWYLLFEEPDGTIYDEIGPYDTKEIAQKMKDMDW